MEAISAVSLCIMATLAAKKSPQSENRAIDGVVVPRADCHVPIVPCETPDQTYR
jgi:hypothetical protein